MSKPKVLGACFAFALAVTFGLTGVAGARGDAPSSLSSLAQASPRPRAAIGALAVVNCQAQVSTKTGDAKFHVCVSSYGNVYSWESPAGWEFLNQGTVAEGFGVCGDTGSGWGPLGWDFEQAGASGFGAPTITQPTAGRFPITVTRSTGVVKLKQVFAVAPKSASLTITETLTNVSTGTISQPILTRWADIDAEAGASPGNFADLAQFSDAATSQVDQGEDHGLQLRAGSIATQHVARLDESPFSFTDMGNGGCANTAPAIAPGTTADYASQLFYYLGGSSFAMAPGASQTVVVQYQRV